MHWCKNCNYSTNKLSSFKKHLTTKKHLMLVDISKEFSCSNCNAKYKYNSGLIKHVVKCIGNNKLIEQNNDVELLKKNLEIEKLKNELLIKDKQLQSVVNNSNNSNNVNNSNNTIINNVKNISKIENLNINFGDVIDINTFIENYKNEYGLSNRQTEVLLSNYKNGGINSCISSLVYYLKESAIQQYKELKGKEITMANIILPFILSDKYLRDHFEKTINGNWDKTTMIDNIKKIVGITDDHVFKHQKTYMHLSDPQKKKLVNGLLKASGYSKLALISDPNLYKAENNEISNE
jgi:hypothetical protein